MPARKGPPRPRSFGTGAESSVEVVGAPRAPLRDFYHLFLRLSWWLTIPQLVAAYVAINVVFAFGYQSVSTEIVGMRPHSFADAFYFSVQTMGTIGYGAMYPSGQHAHMLVTAESVVSLLVTALITGLVFAKFSRSTARIAFSEYAPISPMDGIPTMMIRVGNERSSNVADTTVRVSMVRTEKTAEGMTFYRMYDLQLVRERQPALARSWTVLHRVDAESPLFGSTPAKLEADEVEMIVTVSGTDDTTMQPVHARHAYLADEILYGARLADVLSEIDGGKMRLDVGKFHHVISTPATESFPHSWKEPT